LSGVFPFPDRAADALKKIAQSASGTVIFLLPPRLRSSAAI
jgi:hypothetical protein